jgi:hypothetical protein
VDGITSDAHEVWPNGLTGDELQHIATSIRVALYKNSVPAITSEFQDPTPQVPDMLLGPFDL